MKGTTTVKATLSTGVAKEAGMGRELALTSASEYLQKSSYFGARGIYTKRSFWNAPDAVSFGYDLNSGWAWNGTWIARPELFYELGGSSGWTGSKNHQ